MNPTLRSGFLSHLPYSLALLGLLIVVLAGVNLLAQGNPSRKLAAVDAPSPVRVATDRQADQLLQRLRLRPNDAAAYVQLGAVYLQTARETGDLSYFTRAEAAAGKALALAPTEVGARAMTLMGALMLAQHRFAEAAQWAERALAVDPASAGAYGVLGDAQAELGQYPAAVDSYQSMVDLKPNLESYARVSYVRKLMGDVAGAIEAMELAVADGPPGTESTAWARMQLGDLHFSSGRINAAAEQYQAALQEFSSYHLALAALGKARVAQGRYAEAIGLYRQAVAVVPLPATLAALGDLYARSGLKEQAQLQYDTVEVIARLSAFNQQVYNRELALFYADHNLKPAEALALAAGELEVRRDIYGYDALAWALYKNGRLEEAATAMTLAMRLNTQDPMLFYHAGMVHYRLGDRAKAREYLGYALALNPRFSVLFADEARQALEELRGGPASTYNTGEATP